MYLNNKKIAIYNKDKKVIVRYFKKNDTPKNSDTTTFLLRREKDYNTNKISTFSDENNNYSVTINNMGFTKGNVEGYSGWTERGLQISNKNTVDMDYIPAKTIEININTINWELKRYCFAFAVITEDGSEYIVRGYSWNSPGMYVFPVDDETTSVDSGSLSSTKFENGVDAYHSIVFVFTNTGYTAYIDGVFGSSYTKTVLKNVVGIKLYSSETIYSTAPYESVIFYKNELTESEVVYNYNKFISRISTTGYENMPISTQTEFNTVSDMIIANLAENSIVTTLGYNSIGDNSGATYKIVTYDTFYNELPEDCKTVQINGQVKTTVDNFGNHRLKNGLVAKIISNDNSYTPEQWGAIGDGETSDTEAFICMLALTKTGTINFKDGATYMIASRSPDECSQYTDCRFLKSMVGKFSGGCHRPLIANCNNLVLDGNPSGDGNKATMKIPDNDFGFGMGMLCLAKTIQGLEIKNIIFDSNGLTMMSTSVRGVANKTSNHTIVYDPGSDLTLSKLNNLNIHHCKFLSNGTCVDIADQGGDHILIINPTESTSVYIEDNEFYDWGRWVYSVDLGGSGERFYDYKFNRNRCIQTDDNWFTRDNGDKNFRGLGWIDYEARKCWTGLEVSENTVEGIIGFAMNGNGRLLEDFTFSNNTIRYIARAYRSGYPYFINFYSVACVKNFVCEYNNIDSPWSILPSKYAVDGCIYRHNTTPQTTLSLNGLYGDIIIDNNNRDGYGAIVSINHELYLPDYIINSDAEKVCNFTFTNNNGGIVGSNSTIGARLFKLDDPTFNYMNITISNNKMLEINLSSFLNPMFDFDPNQIIGSVDYGFRVRGARFTAPTKSKAVNMPILGCGTYETGDLVAENVAPTRMDAAIVPAFYRDVLGGGKTYRVYCSKTGYLPQMYSDHMLTYDQSITAGYFYYTDDNLYVAVNGGIKTPTEGDLPTHNNGSAMWGDVELLWVATIGRIRAEEITQ